MKRLFVHLPPLALGAVLGLVLMSAPVVHAARLLAQTVGGRTFVNAFDENSQPKVVELLPCPTTADVAAQITAQINNTVPAMVTTAVAALPPPPATTLDSLLPLLASIPRFTIPLGPKVTLYSLATGTPGRPMLFFASTITVDTATFVSLVSGDDAQCSVNPHHLIDNVPAWPNNGAALGQQPVAVGQSLCLTFSVAASPGGTVTILR